MPSDIVTKLRETTSIFYGALSRMMKNDPFAGLSRRIPAPQGFFKIGDVYPTGSMEDAVGIATVNSIQAASKLYETKGRRYTGGINYETWLQGDAVTGGAVSRAAQISAAAIQADRLSRLTTLLTNGGTGTDMFLTTSEGSTASTAFAATKVIPRANVTFDNKFDGHQNTINGFIHTPPEQGARYVVMVPPVLRQLAADALNPQLSNDAARLGDMGVTYRVNPYLAATSAAVQAAVFYVFAVDEVYTPLAEGWRGPEEFRNTFGRDEAHLILFNQHLFQPYYAMEVGYASTMNMIRITDT
jgi:hypothetical protein